MARKSSRAQRPFEIVMDEFSEDRSPWDLAQHLNGCLAGYQTEPVYGAAVYFALEAVWGIAHDVGFQANAGTLKPQQVDKDWILSPQTKLEVPWIWIRALATAWETYKTERGPLGHAFGLEGGKGKPPRIEKLLQMLDQRAIARWIWEKRQEAHVAGGKVRIEDLVQEAAGTFGKSDVTVRRAWDRFRRMERARLRK
jgi:hypothetical protein